ncbi:MAG TPA: methyltransferase domain-containing protein, partial [Pyrinomonadaceae bacterium]
MSTTQTEMESLKTRLKSMWMAGDFAQIARIIQASADDFVASLALKPGDKVLDVACGSGNLTIPAAQTGATVVGVDIATNLLEQARERAKSEGVQIQLDEGDA